MKGLILFILSVAIGLIFIPLTFAYALVTVLPKNVWQWLKFRYPVRSLICGIIMGLADLGRYFHSVAISVDQAGNTVGYKFFNDVLIKTGGHKFGNPDETISSVLGKNEQINRLSLAGRLLNGILNWIDPGHSTKSIEP